MKVLYIHNIKDFGGASKSLLLTIEEIKKNNKIFEPVFFVSDGNFKKILLSKGYSTYSTKWISIFDNTRFSYYRSFRWLVLIREIVHFPCALYKLNDIIKKEKIDIVHINEAPLFLYAILIKRNKNIKVVLHVRSVQNEKKNKRKEIFNYICNKYVDAIICIDKRVRESIKNIDNNKIEIIYNGFKIKEDISNKTIFRNKDNKDFIVGFVGMLYKAKGIYEILDAIKYLIFVKGYTNIKLYIAGKNTKNIKNKIIKKFLKALGLYDDAEESIYNYVTKNQLTNNIKYFGFLNEIELSTFYKKINILCFPSRLDAIGRPVFEAAFYGKPSIAAISRDYNEIIINKQSGIIIDKPDVKKIADAIEFLYKDTKLVNKMGESAKQIAEQYFDIQKNSKKVYELYTRLISNT